MQLTFRQGIIKAPANFLQVAGNSVNLVIAQPEYLLITIADESSTYLVSEKVSKPAAWAGPFAAGTNYWLFWDIHPLTGAKTYGHTLLAPTEGPTAPTAPANDQHWFDTTTNIMKVWKSTVSRWVNRIRVFAASLSGGSVLASVSAMAPSFAGTQLSSVAPTLVGVGYIVFDTSGNPLRKGTNKFFTTVDSASTGVLSSSRIKIGNILQEAEALANMPAYTVVTFLGFDQIGNANSNTSLGSLFGIIEEDVTTGQITSVTTTGIVSSETWNWTGTPVNTPLYVRDGGVLSTTPAYTGQDSFAKVVGKTSVHFGVSRVSSDYVIDLSSRVAKAGDTMTGLLVLSANPVVALGAATKQYVDANTGNPNFRTFITNNTASGVSALAVNIEGEGEYNTASGYSSLSSNTYGYSNTAVGAHSLFSNTDGSTNTACGHNSLYSNTEGGDNTASGYSSLSSNTYGYSNTAVGAHSLFSNTTGEYNTATGFQSLLTNTTGSYNTASGNTLQSNTTGSHNTASGFISLASNTTGSYNTASGVNSLWMNTTGEQNTAIGHEALSTTTTGSNNTGVGKDAFAATAIASDSITLGNAAITVLRCAATTITALSDARDKTDVSSLTAGLAFINTLNPVQFTWNARDSSKVGIKASGFIAQELKQAQETAGVSDVLNLVYEANPEKLEASYGNLIPVLVKAIQELQLEVNNLKNK